MKNMKKVLALVIAFILTFSALGLVSAAVDEVTPNDVTVPSYNADDLTFKPTYEPTATQPDKNLEEEIGDFIKDEFGTQLGEIGEEIKEEVSESYGILNFLRKALRAFIELFDHIADLLYPSKK